MNLSDFHFRAEGIGTKLYLFYLRKVKKHVFSRKMKRYISRRFFPQGLLLVNACGVRFRASTFDYIDQEIIYKGSYEAQSLKRLHTLMQDGGTFLDVGSNSGLYSLHAAQNPLVKVYAFEPNPQAFVLLQKNKTLNKSENMTLFNLALGENPSVLGMSCPSMNNLGNYQIDENSAEFYCSCVPLSALAHHLPTDEITAIKIDVEGFELQVLKGINWTTQKPKNIILEYIPQQLEKQGNAATTCIEFLSQQGYKYSTVGGEAIKDLNTKLPENNIWFHL